MIQVHFNYRSDQIAGFKLKGHAESGPYGQDIVCAAVSALAINTVNSLEQLVHIKPYVIADDEEGGYMEMKLTNDQFQDSEVQLLLKSFELGLQDIEKNYDKYIEIR